MKLLAGNISESETALPGAIFNGYIGAHAIYALHELGALAILAAERELSLTELSNRCECDALLMAAVLEVMARLRLVRLRDGQVSLTKVGVATIQMQGFFTWAVGGYGNLLGQIAGVAMGERAFSRDVFRDEAKVAIGSGEADVALMRPILFQVTDRLKFSSMVDLGCGDASRLIALCQRHPYLRGVGVDVSPIACDLARRRVAEAGLGDRLGIVCADAMGLWEHMSEALADVQLVTCFMLLHDLIAVAQSNGADLFKTLRAAFPRAEYFLIGDTVRSSKQDGATERPPPIFSLGFELVHAYMGIPLYVKESYEELFRRSNFDIAECLAFGVPNTWLYVLKPGTAAHSVDPP